MKSVHVSRVLPVSAAQVYEFASDPANLHLWAGGLASAPVRVENGVVVVESPMGEVRVRFVAPNDFGVLDHDVQLPDGTVVTNPMRVFAHPEGSEVVFTVRQLGMTDEEFAADCAAVASDLERLEKMF